MDGEGEKKLSWDEPDHDHPDQVDPALLVLDQWDSWTSRFLQQISSFIPASNASVCFLFLLVYFGSFCCNVHFLTGCLVAFNNCRTS